MIENGYSHDPENIYTDPDDLGKEAGLTLKKTDKYIPEQVGLTEEQVQDKLRFAQSLKSIFVYNADNSVNVTKTAQERRRLIDEHELEDTTQYAKNLKIGRDGQGLPILLPKK